MGKGARLRREREAGDARRLDQLGPPPDGIVASTLTAERVWCYDAALATLHRAEWLTIASEGRAGLNPVASVMKYTKAGALVPAGDARVNRSDDRMVVKFRPEIDPRRINSEAVMIDLTQALMSGEMRASTAGEIDAALDV